jgi:alcohol dehydrogenase YqhD (iron-dependent ADH family)
MPPPSSRGRDAPEFSVRSPLIQPKTSILDPEVLYTVTPAYTAYSPVDIVTHMLEGYFTNTEPGESPLQDRMVYAFMRTLMEATEKSLANPRDYDARANFMWSGTLAFNGLTTAGMGVVGFPVHMIEHSLSALYDIAHGAGLSIVLPGWMTWSSAKRPARFARLAREFFGVDRSDDARAAVEGINRLTAWFRSIKSPVTLKKGASPRATSKGSPTTPSSWRRPGAQGLHERGHRRGAAALPIEVDGRDARPPSGMFVSPPHGRAGVPPARQGMTDA